jgi:ribosomal protein S12 methylthiotransferase
LRNTGGGRKDKQAGNFVERNRLNTCGFINAAVDESLEAIGEAVSEHGRVIVTGCLGARADLVRDAHPEVLAVTGPHAYPELMKAVYTHLPPPQEPFASLLPPQVL